MGKYSLFFALNNAISGKLWMWENDAERCRCRSKWHNRPNQEPPLAVISNPIYSQQPSTPARCPCWGKGLNVHLCSLTAPVQHKYRTHARMTVFTVCLLSEEKASVNCQQLLWRCFIQAHIWCCVVWWEKKGCGQEAAHRRDRHEIISNIIYNNMI